MSFFIYKTIGLSENISKNIIKIVNKDILWIPEDLSNKDYQEYLSWVEEGNIPEEYNIEDIIE